VKRLVPQVAWQIAIAFAFALAGIIARLALNASLLSPGNGQCYEFSNAGLLATIALIVISPVPATVASENYRRSARLTLAVLAAISGTFLWSYHTTISCAPL
jgi:hypothetical protein